MKQKDVNEILRSMAVTLFIIWLLSLLVSCTEEYEPFPPDPEYTFFVYDLDNERFTARIDWGVNGIQDHERVTAWGFASSVELSKSDELVLQVDRPGLAARVSNNNTGAARVYLLAPGEFTVIKPL